MYFKPLGSIDGATFERLGLMLISWQRTKKNVGEIIFYNTDSSPLAKKKKENTLGEIGSHKKSETMQQIKNNATSASTCLRSNKRWERNLRIERTPSWRSKWGHYSNIKNKPESKWIWFHSLVVQRWYRMLPVSLTQLYNQQRYQTRLARSSHGHRKIYKCF